MEDIGFRHVPDTSHSYVKQAFHKIHVRNPSNGYQDYANILVRASTRSPRGNDVRENPENVPARSNGREAENPQRNSGRPTAADVPGHNRGANAQNPPPQPLRNVNELVGLGLGQRVRGTSLRSQESSRSFVDLHLPYDSSHGTLRGEGSSSSNFNWLPQYSSEVLGSTTSLVSANENDANLANRPEHLQRVSARVARQRQREKQAREDTQNRGRQRSRSPLPGQHGTLPREQTRTGGRKSSTYTNPREVRRHLASVDLENNL